MSVNNENRNKISMTINCVSKNNYLKKQLQVTDINVIHTDLLPEFFELRSFTAGKIKFRAIDIIRIEASKSYSIFHIVNNVSLVSSHNLTYQSKKLNPQFFFRAGKSVIINLFQIEKVYAETPTKILMNDKTTITVSKRKRDHFLSLYNFFLFKTDKQYFIQKKNG